jgi:hypothetical protein
MEAAGTGWDVRNIGNGGANGAAIVRLGLDRIDDGDVVVIEVFAEGFFQDLSSADLAEFEARMAGLAQLNGVDLALRGLLADALFTARSTTSPLNETRRALRGLAGLGQVEDDIVLGDASFVLHDNGWLERRHVGGEPKFDHGLDERMVEQAIILPPGERQRTRDRVLERLSDDVRTLEARNCRVCFIRMPVTDSRLQLEQRHFPRAQYWDRLAASFPGRSWHSDDFAETASLPTWDGSHLDSEGARAYSRWLGAQIAREFGADD